MNAGVTPTTNEEFRDRALTVIQLEMSRRFNAAAKDKRDGGVLNTNCRRELKEELYDALFYVIGDEFQVNKAKELLYQGLSTKDWNFVMRAVSLLETGKE